jgi:hypothetical protein
MDEIPIRRVAYTCLSGVVCDPLRESARLLYVVGQGSNYSQRVEIFFPIYIYIYTAN